MQTGKGQGAGPAKLRSWEKCQGCRMLRVRYMLRGTGEERALSWADSSGLAEVSVPPGDRGYCH